MHSRTIALFMGLLSLTPAAHAKSLNGPFGVRVDADGSVYQSKRLLKKVALPAPPNRLEVKTPRVEGKKLLWIRILGAAGQSAEILYAGTKLLYSGRTGPQGVDGEWSRHLEVGAAGVLLYERRPGVARCGGEKPFLFPRRYDFARQRFRRVVPPRAKGKRPELRARRTTLPLRSRPLDTFYVAAASSHVGDGGTAANLAPAVEAADGRLATSWKVMGASIRGAFLTLRRPASPHPLRAITFVPGDASTMKAFRATGRVKTLLLQLGDGSRFRLRIPRDPAREEGNFALPYRVDLPHPYTGRCLAISVEDIYPATKARSRTLAVAEVRPITSLSEQKAPLLGLVQDLQHSDATRRHAAARILIRQGDLAISALAAAAPKASGAELETIIAILARLRSAKASRLLFAQVPRISAVLRQRIAPALVALGPAAIPPLEALCRHQRAPLRHYAFRLLGQIASPAARALLLPRIGRGARAERKALVQALALKGPSAPLAKELRAMLAKAAHSRQIADLVLLLGRVTPLTAREESVDALLAIWKAKSSFETRLRLLVALPHLDGSRSVPALRGALKLEDPILRWRALQALQRQATGLSSKQAIELLSDADPRVREAASASLRTHHDREATAALGKLLLRDPWPQVARKAAVALAGRCDKETLTRARQAVRKRGFGIDGLALRNIASCRPGWLLVYLLQVAAESRQPTPLRRLAAGLLPSDLVKRHQRHVKSFFLNLRREALRSPAAEQVAASVVQSIGRSAHPQLAGLLVDALALDPSPLIRASAARALSHLCALPSARVALQRASKDPSPLVTAAARNTLASCGTR